MITHAPSAFIFCYSSSIIHLVSGFHNDPIQKYSSLLATAGVKRTFKTTTTTSLTSLTSTTTRRSILKALSDDDETISIPKKNENDNNTQTARSIDYPSFSYNINVDEDKSYLINIQRPTNTDDMTEEAKNEAKSEIKWNTSNVTVSSRSDVMGPDRVPKVLNILLDSPLEFLDIKNQQLKTRLLENRAYGRNGPLEENIHAPPMLTDLGPPPTKVRDTTWISIPARLLTFLIPYLCFPYLTRFIQDFISMEPGPLDDITSKFAPGVSILYGTFVSLTISILYKRQEDIQENATMESSLLALTTRNFLTLFQNDADLAIQLGQCAADQIRTLYTGSRGSELLLIMYNDPYARMHELIEQKLDQWKHLPNDGPPLHENERINEERAYTSDISLIATCRDALSQLYILRANRLSNEALALPPTHFFILTSLTVLILLGYTISILPTMKIDANSLGYPSNESSVLFGLLCSIYILFYNFANDLNNPFGGIYQIRRSASASHLLQAKWLIMNHPLLRGKVDFTKLEEDMNGEGVISMKSPGLEEMKFKIYDDVYPGS